MNTQNTTAAVILAAGKSTRMKSRLPKAAHPICGKPMGRHVIDSCRKAGIKQVIVVIGHEADTVKAALGDDVEYVVQKEQLGTGDAVRSAESLLKSLEGTVVVLPADSPLIRPESISDLIDQCQKHSHAAVLLTALMNDPASYGRIVRAASGNVVKIVEAKDASSEILAINEICTSIYAFNAKELLPALGELSPENRQKEYYLTDVIGIFAGQHKSIGAVIAEQSSETMGINTRVELAEATRIMRERILQQHMLDGVTIIDPAATYIDTGVHIGQDTILYPGVIIEGETRIGSGCIIGPDSHIADSVIHDDVKIDHSVCMGSVVEQETVIGPYSRLRPGSQIGPRVIIGDFVEIKNSIIHEGVSLAHMTYIGDAEIGAHTNIGAGTITCNFDGKRKHRTTIGTGAFVGSHSTLNAPVTIGDGAFIGSGSVIGKDVPPDALAVARAQQVVKEGWARRRREAAEE